MVELTGDQAMIKISKEDKTTIVGCVFLTTLVAIIAIMSYTIAKHKAIEQPERTLILQLSEESSIKETKDYVIVSIGESLQLEILYNFLDSLDAKARRKNPRAGKK